MLCCVCVCVEWGGGWVVCWAVWGLEKELYYFWYFGQMIISEGAECALWVGLGGKMLCLVQSKES